MIDRGGDRVEDLKLGVVESKFADIIWEHEPVTSGELVRLSEGKLGWKKSTTYTVLKKLCEKGIFQNERGMVTSILSRTDFLAIKSETVVEESFQGSLPAFIAAFTKKRRLSKDEVDEIRNMIETMGGE